MSDLNMSEIKIELPPDDPINQSSAGKRWVGIILVVVVPLVLLGWGAWILLRSVPHADTVFEVPPGRSVIGIAQDLKRAGLIANPWIFVGYGMIKRGNLKAGEYLFTSDLNLPQIYQKIAKGDVITYTVKMIEGWNMFQLARSLAASNFAWNGLHEEFIQVCKDPTVLAGYSIAAPTCEGYLFPDTYKIQRPKDARTIVKRLLDEYKHRITPEMQAQAKTVGLTWPQVMTLASIVEKETAAPQERPHIASVFLNRLRLGMPLESDPTVIYGVERPDNKIYRSDLDRVTPYNTYKIPALPPGPIASPGMAAIQAVLNPMKSDDLFFVSKNDGTHIFSKDYATHSAAVQQYQR